MDPRALCPTTGVYENYRNIRCNFLAVGPKNVLTGTGHNLVSDVFSFDVNVQKSRFTAPVKQTVFVKRPKGHVPLELQMGTFMVLLSKLFALW